MKTAIWALAIIFAVLAFILSPFAGFEFVFLFDAIGFDMFALLVEVQLLVTFGIFFDKLKRFFGAINRQLMRWDGNYFVPEIQTIKEFPPIIIHVVPSILIIPLLITMIALKVFVGLPYP